MRNDYIVLRDDELMHFKYLKRYMKNGKWCYVYANKDVHSAIRENQKNASDKSTEAEYHNIKANANKDMHKVAGLNNTHLNKQTSNFKEDENNANKLKAEPDSYKTKADRLIESNSVKTLVRQKRAAKARGKVKNKLLSKVVMTKK